MKTTFDAVADIRKLINVTEVTELASGGIYNFHALRGLDLPFIVIRPIYLRNKQIQTGAININLHSKKVYPSGLPDLGILRDLCARITPLVEEHYGFDFQCFIHSFSEVYREPGGSNFQAIRLTYQSYNSNFNSI